MNHGVDLVTKQQRFCDDQIWIMLNAPANITNAELARIFDCPVGSVKWLRWRLKVGPWTCRVSWDPCAECGEPLVRAAVGKRYHTQCRPIVLQRLYAGYQVKRSARRTKAELAELIELGRIFHENAREVTAPRATRTGAPWSEDDEDFLINNYVSMSITDMALELGRTYAACHRKLGVLRKRGQLE